MQRNAISWPHESICLPTSLRETQMLAEGVYRRVCRTDFTAPGFCVVNLGDSMDSTAFRRLMVDVKQAMARIHETQTGDTLIYLSAARFDQQETTRLRLDGGPEECFLMLGYEPSEIDAEMEVADYTKCASDMGLSPTDFMAEHNPMFQSGYELLRPYSTKMPFSRADYQIVCINNSSAPSSREKPRWQGTLHTATILTPDESKRRVINSTMIATAPSGSPDRVTESHLQEFVTTPSVRRRGYDKQHLDDDS